MNKITAVLVDDEINARENLRFLLNDFCENVTILAEATNVDEALKLIEKYKPQIVFLDIEMPHKNGFKLLEEVDDLDFQVIFVTAYNSYAIKAFQVAAIDYLLKPIDVDLLTKAVEKAIVNVENIITKEQVKLLEKTEKEISKIAIPYKNDYVIVNINDIYSIEADRMYSIVHLDNGKKYLAAKKLSDYENLLKDNKLFLRVHRSWMVNIDKITTYSKKDKEVVLIDTFKIPVSKGYKDNFEKIFFK
mgnify:CR=1 FL=1